MKTDLKFIVAHNLRSVMDWHGFSTRDVAELSGLPQKTISSMMNADHNSNMRTLQKICDGLRLSLPAMVAGPMPPEVLGSTEFKRHIERYVNRWEESYKVGNNTIYAIREE